MYKRIAGIILGATMLNNAQAGMADDPILTKVMINELEVRNTDGPDPIVWDAQMWIGQDLNKLWIKTEGEYVDDELEEAELQALYSRAIAPYWDLQIGWRHDFRPKPSRDWLVLGLEGLAPYFFEIDASLFIGESGQVSASLEAEYEIMLTQQWVLSPEIALTAYSKNDEEYEIGSGLSNMDLGIRLRYEIKREFAPYIGVNWSKKFGQTADYAREHDEDTSDVQVVAGVRIWF